MNATEKLEQIKARNFTYVQIWLEDENGENVGAKTIIVLTKSKPQARLAVEAVIKKEGYTVRPYNPPRQMDPYSLYPSNYIVAAKAMLKARPQDVYPVEFTQSVNIS